MNEVLVIGVGNRYRRDDGAGPMAAERLRAKGIAAVELAGDGTRLMDAWASAGRVVVIDAARSGAAPGTVHRFDATLSPLPRAVFHHSTHLIGVAEAVEMARALDRLPERLIVYGIEGEAFGFGEGLTEPVARAVESVEGEIARELKAG